MHESDYRSSYIMTGNHNERNRIITFLTDFGTADGYVAAMKGVVLEQTSSVFLVDATHDIPAQDVEAGAWAIHQYWRFYPESTIHIAVVDPGVGSDRAGLLAEADGRMFLAPDNGLLSRVFRSAGTLKVSRIRPEIHHPRGISNTFHGRDVFAYAAGQIAAGAAKPDDLADPVDSYMIPSWAAPECRPDGLHGRIIHVDRFGNLITDIAGEDLADHAGEKPFIHAGGHVIKGLSPHYAAGFKERPLALINSSGMLEIAVRNGSAREITGTGRGSPVKVVWTRQQ